MKIAVLFLSFLLISETNNSGIQELIRRKLETQKTDLTYGKEQIMAVNSITTFYENRVFQPIWIQSKMMGQLIEEIGNAFFIYQKIREC